MDFRTLLHLADTVVSVFYYPTGRRFRVCLWLSDTTRRLVSRTRLVACTMYSLASRVLVIACNNRFLRASVLRTAATVVIYLFVDGL